jgi:hypothetical protein
MHLKCLYPPHRPAQCHNPQNIHLRCHCHGNLKISTTPVPLPRDVMFHWWHQECTVPKFMSCCVLHCCHSYYRSGTQVVQVYRQMWWILTCDTYHKWLHGFFLCLWFRLIISAQLVHWLSLFTFVKMCLNLAISFPHILVIQTYWELLLKQAQLWWLTQPKVNLWFLVVVQNTQKWLDWNVSNV